MVAWGHKVTGGQQFWGISGRSGAFAANGWILMHMGHTLEPTMQLLVAAFVVGLTPDHRSPVKVRSIGPPPIGHSVAPDH